ncbi:LOW QUALITY PROTEIN: transmembrane protein 127-like [Haliotis rubra]|uniref:LOW QUALITY PROTEIN: transmembrane protein 127-like n=1 Tax=Haliotis rubra TaxID=36100 RepID=UPI001EE616B8|nr:LOW QUALITY PROTEIN: transmembrane protein 127-like [Haliotis rubra]
MPSSTSRSSGRNREGGTRRSRSRARSRTRHRESRNHSQSHTHSRFRFKIKERNYPAAVCSMMTIVLLCVSMAEPRWISLRGRGCSLADTKDGYLHSLGVIQFFYSGKLVTVDKSIQYHYGSNPDEVLINCVDSKSVLLFKIVIFFCFLTIVFGMASFLLDLTGPSGRVLQRFHRNAIFSIITVVLCVVINLFCYWISFLVENIQKKTKMDHVEVNFDISFYLVAAAGSASVFAVACNCFFQRRYPVREDVSYQRLNECDDMESLAALYDQQTAPPQHLPTPIFSIP